MRIIWFCQLLLAVIFLADANDNMESNERKHVSNSNFSKNQYMYSQSITKNQTLHYGEAESTNFGRLFSSIFQNFLKNRQFCSDLKKNLTTSLITSIFFSYLLILNSNIDVHQPVMAFLCSFRILKYLFTQDIVFTYFFLFFQKKQYQQLILFCLRFKYYV